MVFTKISIDQRFGSPSVSSAIIKELTSGIKSSLEFLNLFLVHLIPLWKNSILPICNSLILFKILLLKIHLNKGE